MDLKAQKEIQEHFERMYQVGQKPWAHQKEPDINQFFKIISQKKAKILDIGCGNGWISIAAAKQGHVVWGIDSSKTAIKEAKFSARSAKVSKLAHFKLGDALNLPYKDSFFDAAIDRGLFHHVLPQNRGLYLKNILRVLKPESLLYLSVFTKRNMPGIGQMFTKGDIKKIFGKNFRVIYFSQDPIFILAPAHLMHFILERKA